MRPSQPAALLAALENKTNPPLTAEVERPVAVMQ